MVFLLSSRHNVNQNAKTNYFSGNTSFFVFITETFWRDFWGNNWRLISDILKTANRLVDIIEMLAIKKSVVLGSILNETDEKKSLQFVWKCQHKTFQAWILQNHCFTFSYSILEDWIKVDSLPENNQWRVRYNKRDAVRWNICDHLVITGSRLLLDPTHIQGA